MMAGQYVTHDGETWQVRQIVAVGVTAVRYELVAVKDRRAAGTTVSPELVPACACGAAPGMCPGVHTAPAPGPAASRRPIIPATFPTRHTDAPCDCRAWDCACHDRIGARYPAPAPRPLIRTGRR